MEFFRDNEYVRLLGHQGKYLWADEDRHSVAQKRGPSTTGVVWAVEVVPERNMIRLKSVYDLYLMASDYAFLLGATGKKVMQSNASKADSSLEWEPVSAGTFVKLQSRDNTFLRANGGLPPWRNSVTHDVPLLSSTQDVVLWEIEVVKKRVQEHSLRKAEQKPVKKPELPTPKNGTPSQPPVVRPPPPPAQLESSDEDEDTIPASSYAPQPRLQGHAAASEKPYREAFKDEDSASPSAPSTPVANLRIYDDDEVDDEDQDLSKPSPRTPNVKSSSDVRRIFYSIAEDDGEVLAHDDETWGSFLFKGHSLVDLTEQLQLETGIDDDVVLCMRHPLSAKLYKMRLELPQIKHLCTWWLSELILHLEGRFQRHQTAAADFTSQPCLDLD